MATGAVTPLSRWLMRWDSGPEMMLKVPGTVRMRVRMSSRMT
jgi:hypothetical protein